MGLKQVLIIKTNPEFGYFPSTRFSRVINKAQADKNGVVKEMLEVQQIQVTGHKCVHHAYARSLSSNLNGGLVWCPSTVFLDPPCPVTQSVQHSAPVPELPLAPGGGSGAINHLLVK